MDRMLFFIDIIPIFQLHHTKKTTYLNFRNTIIEVISSLQPMTSKTKCILLIFNLNMAGQPTSEKVH